VPFGSVSPWTLDKHERVQVIKNAISILLTLSALFLWHQPVRCEASWVEKVPEDWLRSFPPENQIPSSSDYPGAGAVYLLDEDIFYIADKAEVRVVIMKIFNRRGYQYAQVATPYFREGESVEVRGRTKRKDGTVIELSEDDIHQISLSNDLKRKKFSLPGVEDDCLIHYEIVYRSKRYGLSGIRYFQNEEPTRLSRFNLVVPQQLQVISRESPPGALDTAKEVSAHSEAVSLYTFAARNLLARETEPYMPPSFESFPSLAFAVTGKDPQAELQASWESTSRWYFETFQQHFIPTQQMKKLAKNLSKESASQKEITQRLFGYVQSSFKINFPSRSIFDKLQTIFDRQDGSSAEVSGILYALLRSVDVQAVPVLVPDRSTVTRLPDVPMLDWFSHVLLKVDIDGEELWLDPFVATEQLSCVSPAYRDVDGLLIQPEGGELIRTPGLDQSENLKVTLMDVNLSPGASIQCRVQERYSPARSSELKSTLRKQTIQERQDELAKRVCEHCPGAVLDTCWSDDLDDRSEDFNVRFLFHSSNYLQSADSLVYLNPNILTRDQTATELFEPSRVFSIMLDQLLEDLDTVVISLSPAYQVLELPEPIHLTTDFAQFDAACELKDASVLYSRRLTIKQLMIPAASYQDVKRFFNQVFQQDQKFVVLKRLE
jgi:hypothetical protein